MTPAAGPVVAFVILFPASVVARLVARRALGRGRVPQAEQSVLGLIRLPATLRASASLLTGRPMHVSQTARDPRRVPLLLWGLLALNTAGLLWAGGAAVGLIPVAYPYAVVSMGAAVWAAATIAFLVRAIARIRSPHFGGDRRQAHRIDVEGHGFLDGVRVHVMDLSLTGVRALSYGDVPEIGSRSAR